MVHNGKVYKYILYRLNIYRVCMVNIAEPGSIF